MDVAFRQRVQQRGFSGVGISDNRDDRQPVPGSSFATLLASLSLRFDLALETIDAIADATTISFEFRFAGASAADTACQTRERRILARNQTWQKVLQLRQLDLNLSFFRLRALREDVEDQLRSIDDF